MKSKLRLLIILASVCLVLGVVMWLLLRPDDTDLSQLYPADDLAIHEHDAHYIENESGEYLLYRDSDELEKLVLTNEHGVFTIERDSKTALLTIKELDSGIPVSDSFLEYVWYYATYLSYNAYIVGDEDQPLSLTDFGLDKPSAQVDAYYTDGTDIHFSIGDEISSGGDVYYIIFDDLDDRVFVSEIHLSLFQSESYFIETDFFAGIDGEDDVEIGEIQITGSEIPKKITLKPYSSDDRSDQSYGHDYIITAPLKTAIDDVNVTLLVNELKYLNAQSAVCSSPTKQQLEQYGLLEPRYVFRFFRNGVEQIVNVGYSYDNSCFVTVSGIDVIYNIEPADMEAMLSSSLSYYRSSLIRTYTINALDSISVTFNNTTYDFSATRELIGGEDGYYSYHAYCGENELDLSYYKSFLSVLSEASAVSWDTDRRDDQEVLKIRVSYFDGFGRKDETLVFYPAASNRYLCAINGEPVAKISAVWLLRMMEATVSLSKNQPVTA